MAKEFDISPHLDDCAERLSKGESVRMIAESIGTSHTTLTRHLKRNGIPVPDRSGSAKNTWKNHVHPRTGKKGIDCPVYGRKMSDATIEKMRPIWDKTGDDRRIYRKKHSLGYIMVYAPNHPAADKGGYVLEHRLVIEQSLSRLLSSDEIVHHVNGNKTDNRVENLSLTTRSEHARIHDNLGGNKNEFC